MFSIDTCMPMFKISIHLSFRNVDTKDKNQYIKNWFNFGAFQKEKELKNAFPSEKVRSDFGSHPK